METSVNSIVKNIFQRDTLEQVSQDQLQDFIKQFPYSSIGHVLLSRKKKDLGQDYSKESARAALYVNNPLWLHYFLETDHSLSNNGSSVYEPLEIIPEKIIEEEKKPFPDKALPEENAVIHEASEEEVVLPVESIEPVSAETLMPETDSPATPTNPPEDNQQELAEENKNQATVVEQAIAFEPYHTIDYFASQGIKLKAEDLSNDKFGRQLKSFTDWLRSMKRITPVQTEEQPVANVVDSTIVKNAEESVEAADVDTEAMAEVWIKQGKPARAIAIYQKLSLLNPSKSHYFAAKIEQLNA